ncbi:hypothetical protein NT2_05_03760 [Caenibius tardaugens NBRC 16725]|uniref:Zinc transporter ZntB n=1 Tax=Caenibius tardaugens NBRC 16725 TaxID=1219035 RepID=U2YLD8_9SPHN|nr:CorA family divalent cation transporter [Caenibius tardaugens]AZI36778.1 zinc transporter ZntB [Caenibius tardaugens NBRC 16725]GAD49455.1 hypothetical protein NT2_05_03760 [Caenibius tardaugens NBRC 16725]
MNDFAAVYEQGHVRELSREELLTYAGIGFTWLHIESADPNLHSLGDVALPEIVAGALTAAETRPRCDAVDHGAILNLRGTALEKTEDTDWLVSIRLWVQRGRVISFSRMTLGAFPKVRAAFLRGELADPGDLVSLLAREISLELDPHVAALSDELDDCESALETENIYGLRRTVAQVRSAAISFRRFVAPDRDALDALTSLNFPWLAAEDVLHIREATDRFARMAEELEAVRERAALIHEQLTDLRTELVDQRSLYIAIVAFIFLPLTFITGLLGMNVEGIPFAHHPWAFWGVVAFCALVGLVVLGWFGMRHWLKR